MGFFLNVYISLVLILGSKADILLVHVVGTYLVLRPI
jgi:hypothetical protein